MTLLIRFLSTDRAAALRLIASPNLGCLRSFFFAIIVNVPQRIRFPLAKASRNSIGFSNLIVFGKGCSKESKSTDYAGVRRARPFARRALSTRRPALVDMRARKPCRRARFNRLGWKVLFMSQANLIFFVESTSFVHVEGERIVRR